MEYKRESYTILTQNNSLDFYLKIEIIVKNIFFIEEKSIEIVFYILKIIPES